MKKFFIYISLFCVSLLAFADDKVKTISNTIDEVIWVVGDEPILKSDVEAIRAQAEAENFHFDGDPDYRIPEQIAIQKLFLHQAAIDSLEVTEAEISRGVEQQINYWIQMVGSKEKLEEYKGKTIAQLRKDMHDDFRNKQLEERMRSQLVEDVKVTPAEVRKFFENGNNNDLVPEIPMTVEVQIITRQPRVKNEEINRVKDELRNYTERITSGDASFAMLARLYSEDPGTARQGGELDYTGRGVLDPAFANVAFNLTDPRKVSKIVETEFGYHIIQLIDKRGDKIKCRHILRKPKVTYADIDSAKIMLDSLVTEIKSKDIPFEEAASIASDDKDTRYNNGLMSIIDEQGTNTSRMRMQDLPTEVAVAVERLQVGEISPAFTMTNKRGKTICAVVKLKSRKEAHKATMREDFQALQNVVLDKRKDDFLKEWIENKIKTTYTRLNEEYQNGDYQFQGWVK